MAAMNPSTKHLYESLRFSQSRIEPKDKSHLTGSNIGLFGRKIRDIIKPKTNNTSLFTVEEKDKMFCNYHCGFSNKEVMVLNENITREDKLRNEHATNQQYLSSARHGVPRFMTPPTNKNPVTREVPHNVVEHNPLIHGYVRPPQVKQYLDKDVLSKTIQAEVDNVTFDPKTWSFVKGPKFRKKSLVRPKSAVPSRGGSTSRYSNYVDGFDDNVSAIAESKPEIPALNLPSTSNDENIPENALNKERPKNPGSQRSLSTLSQSMCDSSRSSSYNSYRSRPSSRASSAKHTMRSQPSSRNSSSRDMGSARTLSSVSRASSRERARPKSAGVTRRSMAPPSLRDDGPAVTMNDIREAFTPGADNIKSMRPKSAQIGKKRVLTYAKGEPIYDVDSIYSSRSGSSVTSSSATSHTLGFTTTFGTGYRYTPLKKELTINHNKNNLKREQDIVKVQVDQARFNYLKRTDDSKKNLSSDAWLTGPFPNDLFDKEAGKFVLV